MLKKITLLLAFCFAALPAFAQEIVGKVQFTIVSQNTIQYINPKTKAVSVLKFNDQTKLVDATSFKDFTPHTKFKATVDGNMLASKLQRVLVSLPSDQVIDTDTLEELLADGKKVFIGDARPTGSYQVGHLPTAISTPANKLEKNINNWLPKDKATPIVFYCGGVTCPLSPKAMKIAMKHGYTNVKAYVEGIPAWKGEVYPTHVNPEWLVKNLDIHHVIIDVREKPSSFVKGAVHLPVSQLEAMHQKWNKEKYPTAKRTFFDLRDKKASITIIADNDNSDEAIEAYEFLTYWKFKSVSILKGGMANWQIAKYPLGSGKIGQDLSYEKKLAPGAIDEKEFVAAAKKNTATIIDLRGVDEAKDAHLKNAINIPFAELEANLSKIPKDGLVILHCLEGGRAAMAYTMLKGKGYSNVKYLNDSFSGVAKDNGIKLYSK